MYEHKKGDIFQSGCEAIVNAVNCIGVMGAGLALAFKKKFPKMHTDYKKYCNEGKLRPGGMHVWENDGDPKYIINFPSKDDLSPSKLEYIVDGLEALREVIESNNIKTIAIPALGSGLGGLDYDDVRPLLEEFADSLPEGVFVTLYDPL
jgi:O-acetyl-ADP-ribose deacetylase (regulator of RNase III)